MNSCSNIEIVNFDNFDEEEEDCMKNLFNANSKENCELYNLNNLLTNDRIETESSQDCTDHRSCSGYSDCYIANSTSNSILTEQSNFSENFKCLDLNDSFSINPTDNSNNSFSYTPLRLNMRQKFGRSSLYSSQENSINLENVEYECADENENIVLVESEEMEIRKQKKWVDVVKEKNFKVHKKDYLNEYKKIKNKNVKTTGDNKRNNLNDSECNNQRDSFENNEDKIINYSNGNRTDSNKLKLFKCSYAGCTKAYKSKENMILHMKNIHLKEKPYTCKFCNVSFSHRNGKTYHERKFHTNYLPHKCPHEECETSFASKSAMNYHVKSQHTHDPNRKANRINKSKFNEKIMQLVSLPL